jgi:hypothetical protein
LADNSAARARLDRLELENADPEFAVARGAALFGKSLHRKTERIEAGAARAVFLEVLREREIRSGNKARPSLICVLPRGAPSQQRFEITGIPLEMQTNRLARFQAYSSPRLDRCTAGDIVDWSDSRERMGNAARDMLHGESLDPTLTDRLGNMSCRNLDRRV